MVAVASLLARTEGELDTLMGRGICEVKAQPLKPARAAPALAQEKGAIDPEQAARDGAWILTHITKWVSSKGIGFVEVGGIDAFLHVTILGSDAANVVGASLCVQIAAP